MARWHPASCKVCGIYHSANEPISAQGYCLQHGLQRLIEHNTQLNQKRGPHYESWVRRSLLAAHRQLVALDAAEPIQQGR